MKQNKKNPSYTEVKGKQKFWARIGEAIATAIGGVIASTVSYSAVFLIATIPAAINIINIYSWTHIKEREDKKIIFSEIKKLTKKSLNNFITNKQLRRIVINFTIFTAAAAAIATFTQPYMESLSIPISYFSFVYSGSLLLSALAVRYSYKVEELFGQIRTVNTLTLITIIPALILGLGFKAIIGIALFFIIVIIENIRSPILTTLFHDRVKSTERSTMGSLLEQSKSLGKIILLQVIG